MALPLPSLDVRHWRDLVDEGTALVPRYAPAWDEHNISDPGITLLELLAWLVEQDLYRVDRVPERHRLAFLALLGFAPAPPRAARAAVAFSPAPAAPPSTLPAGLAVAATASPAAAPLVFRTLAPVSPAAVTVTAVQSFDGAGYVDRTAAWHEGQPIAAWGDAPSGFGGDAGPALLLGLDGAPPSGRQLSLWIRVAGGAGAAGERAHLAGEAQLAEEACRPARPSRRCEDGDHPSTPGPGPGDRPDPVRAHHALRTVWEQFDGAAWEPLAATDDTRALTLDGPVVLTPGTSGAVAVGAVADPLHWLRCRATAGPPDIAPMLLECSLNAVEAEQRRPLRHAFEIEAGVPPAPADRPVAGTVARLRLEPGAGGGLATARAGGGDDAPRALVLDYRAPSPGTPGLLACTLLPLARSSGAPSQAYDLSFGPLAGGDLAVWTLEPGGAVRWTRASTLDGAGPADALFTLDAQAGRVRFGDGRRGRVPPPDVPLLASGETTAAAAGAVPPAASWTLEGADDDVNRPLLGREPAVVAGELARIASTGGASAGADAETVEHAAGRAAEEAGAHERLLDLAPAPGGTLDGCDPAIVRATVPPARGATALDLERLALGVAGTRVLRARAWPEIDPAHPGLTAPGIVTVVIVPGWPPDRPQPGAGLISVVRGALRRRRTLGTRVEVAGPGYVELQVLATVRAIAGADAAAVAAGADAAVRRWLHPLNGGPLGRGWPFGRDVRRADLLALLDGVAGVDHVETLEVAAADDPPGGCGDVCVPPLSLVALTDVVVEALP